MPGSEDKTEKDAATKSTIRLPGGFKGVFSIFSNFFFSYQEGGGGGCFVSFSATAPVSTLDLYRASLTKLSPM